jgi:tripartite-type tricarboxylate transporter receptor subunit TctC
MIMGAKTFMVLWSLLAVLTLAASAEGASTFPQKSIRLIVPYAAGSGADTHARRIAPYATKYLGVTIMIENLPGADGRLAMNELWRATPDGYTLLTTGMPAPIINEKLFPVKYKFLEFTQVFGWTRENIVLVANSETWKSTDEFISAAKAKTLAGGISGTGSVSQVAGLILEDAAKFKPVNWVPFGGGSETMANLAGKHIDFGITGASSARGLVTAGKLRVLLIFSNEKDILFPEAPLPKEVGLTFETTLFSSIRLVFGPPGLPPQTVTILEQAFLKAVGEPEYLDWAKRTQFDVSPMSRNQCLTYVTDVENEVTKYLDKIQVKK